MNARALFIFFTVFALLGFGTPFSTWAQPRLDQSSSPLNSPSKKLAVPSLKNNSGTKKPQVPPSDLIGKFLNQKILSRPQMDQKGGWGGNGGGGLACFEENSPLPSSAQLKLEDLSSAKTVAMIEFLEFDSSFWILPNPKETANQYLARVVNENLAPVLPLFASKLSSLIALVSPQKWIPVKDLPLIDDTGSLRGEAASDRCIRVQIARRYELHRGEEWPVVKLEVAQPVVRLMRQSLPRQLAVLNEAILILHEALYVLGVKFGHVTSVESRDMVATLLGKSTYENTLGSNLFTGAIDIQQRLFKAGFHRYVEHFTKASQFATPLQNELASVLPSLSQMQRTVTGEGKMKVEDLLGPNPSEEAAALSIRLWQYLAPRVNPAQAFLIVADLRSMFSENAIAETFIANTDPVAFEQACKEARNGLVSMNITVSALNSPNPDLQRALRRQMPEYLLESVRQSIEFQKTVYQKAATFCQKYGQ